VESWAEEVRTSSRKRRPASPFQQGATQPERETHFISHQDCGATEKSLEQTVNFLAVLRENAGKAASMPASVFSVSLISDEESMGAEELPEETPEEHAQDQTSEDDTADTRFTRQRAARVCRSDTISYREMVLEHHGIFVSEEEIPPAVKDMALGVLNKEREESELTAVQLAEIKRKIARVAKAGELRLTKTLVLLLCPPEEQYPTEQNEQMVVEGCERIWNTAGMPYVKNPEVGPVSKPKPDHHYGFTKAAFGLSDSSFFQLLQHRLVRDHAYPNHENYFPFMVMEFKSEACFGHFRHAENQAAGGGALCVNNTRTFLKLAGSTEPDMLSTIAFSCLINARIADVWVHWHKPAQGVQRPAGSSRATFLSGELIRCCIDTPDGIQRFMNAMKNILDWGAQSRLPILRAALLRLEDKGGLDWLECETELIAQASAKAAAEAKSAAQAFAKAAAEGRSVASGGKTGSKASGSRVKAGRVMKPQAPVKTSATRKRPAPV